MQTSIKNALKEIEAKEGVEILYACESGSRAWGFPSPDSDYDVRFIYKRKENDYLSISIRKDHLGFPVNNLLDLYGWDIRKLLQLIQKSNATPFEWLQSPIVYDEIPGFRNDIVKLLPEYFCAKTQLFHYLGIANGAMETITDKKIKIKRLFYVLRPLLAANWISNSLEYPPMNINPLLETVPNQLKTQIEALIFDKSKSEESFLICPDSELLNYIIFNLHNLKTRAVSLDKKKMDSEALNNFFRKCIQP